MAYNYNNYKKFYEAMDSQQQKNWANQNKNDSDFQSFYNQYTAESNKVNQVATDNSNRYGSGNYSFNPTSWYYEKQPATTNNNQSNGWPNYVYNPTSWYYEDSNKVNNSINTPTNSSDFYGQWNTGYNTGNTWNTGNWNTDYMNQAYDIYNKSQKWYSDLMGGGSNYADNFDDAVSNKLKTAFWINSLAEFKSKYPEYYDSLVSALDNIEWVRDATDPNQRQMLDWQLQGIIGSMVWAGSDTSKLKVLEESVLNKFQNPDQVKSDMQNIVKLQTEWKSTAEIASEMWISEDQVQQAILAYNWLDNKLWEYYKLTDKASKDITEPYDTKLQRLEEEKKIALERANRNVDYLKQDFDTTMERQKKANEINAHNADAISWQYGYGFSKRGIEWLNYVNDQAQQLIDDLTKNYDRNKQEMADGIADIIRNWQYNNEDLNKAMQDALTNAKNNYTSNMLAIQQQYGTVGMQAQQYLAQNIQSFIEQAENIYDNWLARQQENLSNLITNISNLNALAYQDITLRNAKIQQFQSESMNLNRNQLQQLATQLGMDSASYQDLVNYQAQAVANELNWYLPWSWMQFQSQIQSLLNQWYTPTEAMNQIMNSAEFKAATTQTGTWHNAGNGYLYDDYGNIKQIEWYNWITTTWTSTADYTTMWNYWATNSYVSSETVNWKNYGVSENTYNGLQNFINEHQVWSTGGQCGKFVNDYLESIGQWRIFTDPITEKKKYINTEEWYKPQVWDVVIMDSPTARKYGHVAIVTAVDGDKITTLESNKKWEWEVFTRTIDTSKQNRLWWQIFWYYHPDGETTGNTAAWWEYNQILVDLFNKDSLTSEDKKTIASFWMTLSDFWNAKKQYAEQNKWDTNSQAYKTAEAVMNGRWKLPSTNRPEYQEALIALDDLLTQKYWNSIPQWYDLMLYSAFNEKALDASAVDNLNWAFNSIYSTNMLNELLDENSKKIWPILSKMEWWNPYNADYAAIKASINQMSSNIARWFWEKWVLTDADIERYMETIPNEKMWDNARQVVWELLLAKLYKWLMTTLEWYAKWERDVHLFASDYQQAKDRMVEHWFMPDDNWNYKTRNTTSALDTLSNQLNNRSNWRISAGGTMVWWTRR